MREIGGYFEWEMAADRTNPHTVATATLKSGRSCLALILDRERPRQVRVPYYLCEGALEPFTTLGVPVSYYPLDARLEVAGDLPDLEDDERLLYVNYFGLKSAYVQRLEKRYGQQLWVDHVQAFFHVPVNSPAWHFNSARKFFGVPDGAYLHVPTSGLSRFGEDSFPANLAYRLDHLVMRLEGRTQEGLAVFQENEQLNGGPIAGVSDIGKTMLGRIDYAVAAQRRRQNYQQMHATLRHNNRLSGHVTDLGADAVPFCYPYLPEVTLEHAYFWEQQIYPPVLWKECQSRLAVGYTWEKTLAADLLPLPIDQRCTSSDVDRVLAAVADYPTPRA